MIWKIVETFCLKNGAAFKLKYERCTQDWVGLFKEVKPIGKNGFRESMTYFCEKRAKSPEGAARLALSSAYQYFEIPMEEWE
jgi:hypothetical protein